MGNLNTAPQMSRMQGSPFTRNISPSGPSDLIGQTGGQGGLLGQIGGQIGPTNARPIRASIQQPGGLSGPPQKPGGPPQAQKPGGPPQPNFNVAPQIGYPPPTGKPGMPPVNPGALPGMRPQIGSGILPAQPRGYLEDVASQAMVTNPGSYQTAQGLSVGGRLNPLNRPF